MELDSQTGGLAILCNSDGIILKILRDDLKIASHVQAGQPLVTLVDGNGLQKILDFLIEVQTYGAAFDWELNFKFKVEPTSAEEANYRNINLYFAGGLAENYILVVGAPSQRHVNTQFYEELMMINNEQMNSLRTAVKDLALQVQTQREQASENEKLYDELSRLNNELIAVQRELAKKNVQLQETNKTLQREITERKRIEQALRASEATLRYTASHDPLTNLPNRTMFIDRLNQVVQHAKENDHYLFAVFFLDMNDFKQVNDNLGHQAGDQLLINVAQRLTTCIKDGDMVARMGGDEFTVLLEKITDFKEALEIAEQIKQELAHPIDIEGQEVLATASIGIASNAIKSKQYDQADDLLREADMAMYAAKLKRKNRI